MQPPVRVKLYGLISLTRRTYLICVAVGAAGLVVMLILWWVTARDPTPLEVTGQFPLTPWHIWRNYAQWVIAAGAALGGIEAYFVLRRFRRAEAERQHAAGAQATTPRGS
jgi:hypothetical protein